MYWPPPDEAPLDISDLRSGQELTEQHINIEATLNEDTGMVNNPEVKNLSSRTKKRKLKSRVWDDFRKYEDEDGKEWATCNHCKKKFGGSSKSGTTHLKNHIERCPSKLRNPGTDGLDKSANKTGDCLTTTTSANIIKGKSEIDKGLNQLDETRMIIKYWVPSLVSIKHDILDVFKEEKQKLMRYFHKLPCRFNVSIDCHFDVHYIVYVSVHFIDDNWELKKKVMCVSIDDEVYYRYLCEKVKCLFKDWNMDKNICSIVYHWASTAETKELVREMVTELRGSLPSAGAFLPLHLFVNFLHSEIKRVDSSVITDKMRPLMEYVRKIMSSEENNNKFKKIVDKAAAKSMGIKLTSQPLPPTDDENFKLVEWVMGLKEALWELEQMDDSLKPINLTEEQWEVLEFWKELKDAVDSLCGCKYITPNVCFSKVCHLYMTLLRWEKRATNFVHEMASVVRYFFDEYWNISNLVLAITVVLDPRFKMDIVECWYVKIYGESADTHINKVNDEITNIYKEYLKAIKSPKTSAMLDPMGRPCTSSCQVDHISSSTQSELDRYLKDSKFPAVEDFDILAWWRSNSLMYPTLARMARDYLAIPIGVRNSLGSSLENEIVNIFYNDELDDDTKEALVHSKIWLYGH